MLRAEQDAYGAELRACLRYGSATEIVERDDGKIEAYSAHLYFSRFDEWPEVEQQAIGLAGGAAYVTVMEKE